MRGSGRGCTCEYVDAKPETVHGVYEVRYRIYDHGPVARTTVGGGRYRVGRAVNDGKRARIVVREVDLIGNGIDRDPTRQIVVRHSSCYGLGPRRGGDER